MGAAAVIVAAFDTATSATVVGVQAGCDTRSSRFEAPPGGHPAHSAQLLGALSDLLGDAGAGWGDVEVIGVGVGPGTFTGLRIASATAEGLRRATGARVVPVDTLEALALPALAAAAGRPVCALTDARRGEVFAAGWRVPGEKVFGPVAVGPEELPGVLGRHGGNWLIAGDRPEGFGGAASDVAGWLETQDPLNLLDGAALCELARSGNGVDGPVLPEYVRAPDAKRPGT